MLAEKGNPGKSGSAPLPVAVDLGDAALLGFIKPWFSLRFGVVTNVLEVSEDWFLFALERLKNLHLDIYYNYLSFVFFKIFTHLY